MASSELSSDVLGGSRPEYADNSHPGFPPGLAAAGEPISLVDEGMWKRYSSHYEFPLSMLLSLSIHLLVAMVVLAVMTISFYFGKPPVPELQTIVTEGVGPDPTKPVGGSSQKGDDVPKDIDHLKPSDDIARTHLTDVPPDQIASEFDRELLRQRAGRRDAFGNKPGKGAGDGEGDDIGPGAGGRHFGRNARWKVNLHYDEPEALVAQLSNLQVIVAARLNSGRFLVFQDLPASGPVRYQELTLEDCAKFVLEARRLSFHSPDANTAANFAHGVGLGERVLDLWIYIPKEMESALLEAERKRYGLTEAQVRERRLLSTFDVHREGDRWVARITKTAIAPPPVK